MANGGTDDSLLSDLVTASRQLGSDDTLVLGGGGNTSVKSLWRDVTGKDTPVLYIKGSGHELATIDQSGFAPLRLDRVKELLPPTRVPEELLRNELRCALLDATAPDPSVETLVHALLPQTAVLHSHADALVTLTNSVEGIRRLPEILPDCVIVEYAMPGPDLVAACAEAWSQRADSPIGIVVLGHGLFTVGDTPSHALERHLAVIDRVKTALPNPRPVSTLAQTEPDYGRFAMLRNEVSALAGRSLVARVADDPQTLGFIADATLLEAVARGPLTPDHVSWTRYQPCIGTNLSAYAADHQRYFDEHRGDRDLARHDLAPRVIFDGQLGLISFGRNQHEAQLAESITKHTMQAVRIAEALGGYRPAGPEHVFNLEYWGFQEKKLTRTVSSKPLAGQIALVTGAASGIGRGCASQLLAAGACVVGWDMSPQIAETFDSPNWLGIQVDVTDPITVQAALNQQVREFGGLDILVVAAGIFPPTENLGDLNIDTWRKTMSVNLDAVMRLYGMAHPLLAQAFPHGRVVLIASKNVAAPGPGAAAYSASKAAVTQLTRVAALEWASAGIRVNMVHPDAVFDTGLWTPELLASRAAHYGMSIDEYKRRNLLHTEITSKAVGELTLAMCQEAFACTTGAQVPIDGGNERVI